MSRLAETVERLAQPGKGLLAADESTPTITKRFAALGIDSNEESRRKYRQLLLGSEGIGDYVSGVILYEETFGQSSDDGTPLVELAAGKGVVPGIKLDKGLTELVGARPGEKITRGLDELPDRAAEFVEKGARFAKWRNVYTIGHATPSRLAIDANAEVLARYAAICQQAGLVPVVEPEVLIDGDHDIDRCMAASEAVFHAVFHALHRHGVELELMLLKPSMVISGKGSASQAGADEVGEKTAHTLRRTVPAAVPSINFLSGGQTPEQATANLNAINSGHARTPWNISFSYARALQEPAMAAWGGKDANTAAAREAFIKRARLNSTAARGEYDPSME